MEDLNQKAEDWYNQKHKDIETSIWISNDMRYMYKNLLTQAFKDGLQMKG